MNVEAKAAEIGRQQRELQTLKVSCWRRQSRVRINSWFNLHQEDRGRLQDEISKHQEELQTVTVSWLHRHKRLQYN